MALRQGGEQFTKWAHLENGQVMVRRLHRMEIQTSDGRLHVLEGDQLPNYLQTCTGNGYKGKHVATLLLSPSALPPNLPREFRSWPAGRDVLHLALGMCICLLLVRLAYNLAQAMP